LLNEFLKEPRKNEEQEATIAQLKSGIEALVATVKETGIANPKGERTALSEQTCSASGQQSLMQPDWHQHAMCVRSPDTWLRSYPACQSES
jgi:hypothetical protein